MKTTDNVCLTDINQLMVEEVFKRGSQVGLELFVPTNEHVNYSMSSLT